MVESIRIKINQFWFGPISPISLSVFRIFYGLIVLENALLLAPDLLHWFGKHAMVSQQAAHLYLNSEPRFSLFYLFPDNDLLAITLYLIQIVSALTLTLGIRSRLSAAVLWLTLLSFQERNPYIFNACDTILRQQAFLLMFSRAGALISVENTPKTSDSQGEIKFAPWAQRLLQLQLAFVYCDVFASKIACPDWINGNAVYFASRLADFTRFPVPLLDHLWVCHLATWTTLLIELALFTLIWFKPLRYIVIVLGTILHVGIDWSMTIPVFEYVMIVGLILFIDPSDMALVVSKFRRFCSRVPFTRRSVVDTIRPDDNEVID